jgi:hypothetical protein
VRIDASSPAVIAATARRAVMVGDALDQTRARTYQIRIDGRIWHLTADPDGATFVTVERADGHTIAFSIDEPFVELEPGAASMLALLWNSKLRRDEALRAMREQSGGAR